MERELIFKRKDGFYGIMCDIPDDKSLKQVAEDNAKCNKGTLSVETLDGQILWEAQNDK